MIMLEPSLKQGCLPNRKALLAGVIILSAILSACVPAPKPPRIETQAGPLERLQVQDYPQFRDDLDYVDLTRGIDMSLVYLRKLPANTPVAFGPDQVSVAHLIRSLEAFAALAASAVFLSQHFVFAACCVIMTNGKLVYGEIWLDPMMIAGR